MPCHRDYVSLQMNMFAIRKPALRILLVLVVVWATLAILGGAAHIASQGDTSQGPLTEVGIGLCALTLALLLSTTVGRVPGVSRSRLPFRKLPRWTPACSTVVLRPPPTVSLLRLLRILRA